MALIRAFRRSLGAATFGAMVGAWFALAASVHAATTTLTACEKNSNHKISFPAVGKSCASGETTLTIVLGGGGPTGPTGPTGSTGPTGPSGPSGATGPKGASGASIQGPPGLTGLTGATGPVGPSGPAGPSGADGSSGPTGPSGPAGATGPVGAVQTETVSLSTGVSEDDLPTCPQPEVAQCAVGEVVVGGSATYIVDDPECGGSGPADSIASNPTPDGDGWQISESALCPGSCAGTVTVYAICAEGTVLPAAGATPSVSSEKRSVSSQKKSSATKN